MESQISYLIVGAIALLIGIVIGWLISKSRARIKFISGQAKFDSQAERITELNTTIDRLNTQIDLVRNDSQTHANNATRFESGLSGSNIRIGELQNELKGLYSKYEIIEREFSAAKEIHAGLKAKHDKQMLDTIEIANERVRLKDQVEGYRFKENELNKKVAELTAKYEESQKSLAEQKVFIESSQVTLKDSFNALSAAALDQNNQSFLDLAKTALDSHVTEAKGDLEKRQQSIDGLVKPLGESLTKMDEKINSLENKREGAYGNITALLDQVKSTNVALD